MAETTPTPTLAIPVSLDLFTTMLGYLFQFLLFAQFFKAINEITKKVVV